MNDALIVDITTRFSMMYIREHGRDPSMAENMRWFSILARTPEHELTRLKDDYEGLKRLLNPQ